MTCPRCSGSGQCPDCHGQGIQECATCSGSGVRQTPRGIEYRCKSCEGAGTMACPPKCSSCEGTGEITPELQKKVRDTYTVRFSNFTPMAQTTKILVIANMSLFFLGEVFPQLFAGMLLKGDFATQGRYWEILTYSFQHIGIMHLLMNMGFLWTYGPVIEGILGRARYLALYLGAGIIAGLVSWAGHSYFYGTHWSSGGASGSLFGLDGAMLALYWRWRMLSWEEIRSLSTWAAIILLGGAAAEMRGFNLLDNWAHLGGLLGGFVIVAALPRPRGH